jgi:hypothetical protein
MVPLYDAAYHVPSGPIARRVISPPAGRASEIGAISGTSNPIRPQPASPSMVIIARTETDDISCVGWSALRYDLDVHRLAILSLLFAGLAAADGARVDVEVGKTVERDVAIAIGWFCDDPSLVAAEMVTRGNHNVWIVHGAKVGTTQCRVGTDPSRVAFVFDVHVLPPKKQPR